MGVLRLKPWQEEASDRMVGIERQTHGGILADDVGLGKTYTAMALIQKSDRKRTLVLCPAMLVGMWMTKLNAAFSGLVSVAQAPKEATIMVCSFDREAVLKQLLNLPRRFHWYRVIVDEAHAIKNGNCQRSNLVQSFATVSVKRWALTATPIENDDSDMYELMRFVGFDGDEQSFMRDRIIMRSQREIREKHSGEFTVPEPLHNPIRVPLVLGAHVVRATHDLVGNGNEMTHLIRCRQACLHPGIIERGAQSSKVAYCINLVERHPGKFVMFTSYTGTLDLFFRAFQATGLGVCLLTGEMDQASKDASLKEFRDTDARVLFSNIMVGGVGIDLSHAKNVVIMEPQWNPFAEKQAIGRAVRTGQVDVVKIWKLIGVFRKEQAGPDTFRLVDRNNAVSLIKTGSVTVDEAVVVKQHKKACIWCNVLGARHADADADAEMVLDSYMDPSRIAVSVSSIVT